MANCLTSLRIICSIILIFCPTLSPLFFTIYIIAGFTDMIDGTVARKTNSVSEFGARLDTIADFIFLTVCIIKMVPIVDISLWIYIWISGIALIKMINITCSFLLEKKLVTVHTVMNKVTGALLFAIPLTYRIIDKKYLKCSILIVLLVATFAAIQEGHYLRLHKGT